MSLLDALIIYLSAGAPFGVLVFFSRLDSTSGALGYSLLATVGWPVVAMQRLFRAIGRRRRRRYSRVATELDTRQALISILESVPTEPGEIFEIAGHPKPHVATVCYARSRRHVVSSHLERLAVTECSKTGSLDATEDRIVAAAAPHLTSSPS